MEQPREFAKLEKYAKLKRWWNEARKAASEWHSDHSRTWVNDGFKRGNAASTIFQVPETQMTYRALRRFHFRGLGPRTEEDGSDKCVCDTTSRCAVFCAVESETRTRLRSWTEPWIWTDEGLE